MAPWNFMALKQSSNYLYHISLNRNQSSYRIRARNSKSMSQQIRFWFHTSVLASSDRWRLLAFLALQMRHSNFCLHLHMAFSFICACVQISLFLKGHLYFLMIVAHDTLVGPHINYICKDPIPKQSLSQVLGGHEFWKVPIQCSTEGNTYAMHFRTIFTKMMIFCKVKYFGQRWSELQSK